MQRSVSRLDVGGHCDIPNWCASTEFASAQEVQTFARFPNSEHRATPGAMPSRSYLALWAGFNGISVCCIALWGLGHASIHSCVAFETAGFLARWLLEAFVFGEFADGQGRDLLLHHAAMLIGIVSVYSGSEAYAAAASVVLLRLQWVHLPLALNWTRKLFPRGTAAHTALLAGYLGTWLLVVAFRGWTLVEALGDASGALGKWKYVATVVPLLDYAWTPWHLYARLLTPSSAKAR